MNIFIKSILGLGILCLGMGCQEKVEGCMHPRAINFDPEADVDEGCNYFELTFSYQHYCSNSPDSIFSLGDTLLDKDNQAFVVTKFCLLGSALHLLDTLQGIENISIELLNITDFNANRTSVEDNFYLIHPELDDYEVCGWVDLGTYNRIETTLGLTGPAESADPEKITETAHPLSSSAFFPMYDNILNKHRSFYAELLFLADSSLIQLESFNTFPLQLEGMVTVVDDQNTTLPLFINYDALFTDLSLMNDPMNILINKIEQNLSQAIEYRP